MVGFDHKCVAGVRVVAGVEDVNLVTTACGGLQMPEGDIALNDPGTEDVEIVVIPKFACEDCRDFRGKNDRAIHIAVNDSGSDAFLADRRATEFFRGPRKLPIGGSLSRLGNHCLRDRVRAVSPRAPDEGQYRGDLMVIDRASEPEPGHVEVPLLVPHFDRSDQTVEDDLGQSFGRTADPFAASQGWRQSWSAATVRLVATGAELRVFRAAEFGQFGLLRGERFQIDLRDAPWRIARPGQTVTQLHRLLLLGEIVRAGELHHHLGFFCESDGILHRLLGDHRVGDHVSPNSPFLADLEELRHMLWIAFDDDQLGKVGKKSLRPGPLAVVNDVLEEFEFASV